MGKNKNNIKIAILIKNYTNNIRDVGDINGLALYKGLGMNGYTTHLVYLNTNRKPQEDIIPITRAIFNKYDVIYASSPKRFFGIMCILFSIIQLKKMYLSVFDSTIEPAHKGIFGAIFKTLLRLKIIQILAVSKYQRNQIKRKLGYSAKILYPCLLKFGYNNKYQKSKNPTILFAGSTDNKKRGLETIIKACEIVAQTTPELKLIILNKFNQKERQNEPIFNYRKLSFEIENIGFAKKIEYYYKSSWLYVIPFNNSKYIPPIPFTFLEAMSYTLPVLTSNLPQFKEIVGKKYTIEPGDSQSLAKLMINIIINKESIALSNKYFPQRVVNKFILIVLSQS